MPNAATRITNTFEQIYEADFSRLRAEIESLDLSHKTLLISGATGFFGAWLLALCAWVSRHIKPAKFKVIAISRMPAAFFEKHPSFKQAEWLEWIEGDIRSFAFPAHDVDWVIHAATDTSAEAGKDPLLLFDTIVGGTRHILDCANACNANRILLVSSGAVYGTQPPSIHHQHEDSAQACNPLVTASTYGEAKRVMELLGTIHADTSHTAVMSARCYAFVGAGLPLDGHFAIGNFIRDALSRPQLTISGDGMARRSYLYTADLAIWLMRILSQGQSGRTYNVGSDQDLSIAELASCVLQTLAPSKLVVIENRLGPSPVGSRYVPSINRARNELGLDVWTTLPEAVESTAVWQGSRA